MLFQERVQEAVLCVRLWRGVNRGVFSRAACRVCGTIFRLRIAVQWADGLRPPRVGLVAQPS